jgi:hypothetical protein
MIALSWNSAHEPNSYDADKHIGALMGRFKALPRHIAKKHLKATMRRAMKPGIPILRRNTPKRKKTLRASAITRDSGGRFTKGSGKVKNISGALRKAATVRVGQTGNSSDYGSFVWGVLGYKAGFESRKAIWLEFGTASGARAFRMMEKTYREMGPVTAATLRKGMAEALEKATAELASKRNPGGAPGFRRKR